MSEPYEEILSGQKVLRGAPGPRHELICERLHQLMVASVTDITGIRLLAPRTAIQLSPSVHLCPDLALVNAATGALLLVVEVVSRDDHRPDTVTKKDLYDSFRVPRLWMVDPRYHNVEVYHQSDFGLRLKAILACQDVLAEELVPEFAVAMTELFAEALPA